MSTNTKTQINLKEILKRSQETCNLYDLIPVSFDTIEKISETEIIDAEIIDDTFTDIKNKINDLINLMNNTKKYKINTYNFKKIIKELESKFNEEREKYFKEKLEVPLSAIQKYNNDKKEDDIITYATLSQRTQVKNIKKVAEALGFLIIPWEIHNKDSYKNENENVKNAIKKFQKLKKYCDLYVVSPINYWDIKAHITSDNPNKTIFASSKIKNIVSSVEIQLPLLREIYFKLENYENRIKNLEVNVKKTINSINELQEQFEKITLEIAEIRKDLIKKNEQIKKLNYELEKTQVELEKTKELFRLKTIDPLLFAVKKDSKLNDDDIAIIGPVWGPDFSILVPIIENIEIQLGQRKLIEKTNPFLLN